jgi:cytochrome c oxidase subunit 4
MAAETATAESDRLKAHADDTAIPASALDGAEHEYPADKKYWIIALVLAAITLVEVSTYWPLDDAWAEGFGLGIDLLVPSLLLMMAIKFWTVTWFFMHLRFDSRLLTMVFYFGLVLAVVVYIVALATFEFFG